MKSERPLAVVFQEIFRVVFFRRLGEIERAGQDFLPVDDHDFIVGNRVSGVDKRRNSGIGHKISRRIFFAALAPVQNDLHFYPSPVSVNESLGDGRARERMRRLQAAFG
jgi:hypothetical protein